MPFSLKNHSVLSWNALLLLAAFLLAAGCGPASSGSGQSQPPAAAATQPAAETVTQGTGPVPETLWDKRAEYEKEGQVVLFTDCGLYKGDTDELTGAKCEFRQGRWVLLEPKLEPKDNLIKNGDFSEWNEDMTLPLGYTYDRIADATYILRPENKDFISPPFALNFQAARIVDNVTRPLVQLNVNFTDDNIRTFIGRKVTFIGDFKLISNNTDSIFSIDFLTYLNQNKWITDNMSEITNANTNEWLKMKLIYTIRKDAKRCFLRLMFNTPGSILIDNLGMYRGFFPMF